MRKILRGCSTQQPIAARDCGGRGARAEGGDTFRPNMASRKVMHGFRKEASWYSATSLPVQLEAGGNALAAGGLPDVGDSGCHMQRAVKLLISAEGVVRHRIIAGVGKAGTQCGPCRQDIELDHFLVAKDLLGSGR